MRWLLIVAIITITAPTFPDIARAAGDFFARGIERDREFRNRMDDERCRPDDAECIIESGGKLHGQW